MFVLHLVEKNDHRKKVVTWFSNDHITRFSGVKFPLYEYFFLLFFIHSEAIKSPNRMTINTGCLDLHWQKCH